jgi:hypothetical protein
MFNDTARAELTQLSRVFYCFAVDEHHMRLMAKDHPHAGASYRVVVQEDSTYGVEVMVPCCYPALVTSFATEEIADAWITDHKRRVAENAPRGFMRARSARS